MELADKQGLLRHGREIVLPVTPVDPRDLFRGDYVILGYAVAQVPGPAGESGKLDPGPIVPGKATPAAALRPRTPLYATLEQQADGGWQAVASSRTHPGSVATNQVVLQGRTNERPWSRPGTVQLRYGIESYFVPEGQGRELEKLVRDKKIAAVIAIDAKGRAAIKGLMVDGKLIHRESPL